MKLNKIQVIKGLLILVGLGLGLWWLLTPRPVRVRSANVGTHSFSLGWFSKKPSKSCVVAVKSFKYQDLVIKCEKHKSLTHLVEVKGVRPDSYYYLGLIDFPRLSVNKILPVTTTKISDQPPQLPEPAFGGVIDQNSEPVEGVLIYIEARLSEYSYPVAALTNREGNYAVDMGLNINKAEVFFLDAVSSGGIWAEKMVSKQFKTPIPTIIVNTK